MAGHATLAVSAAMLHSLLAEWVARRQFFHFHLSWWMIVLAVVLALIVIGLLAWFAMRRR